MRRNYLYYHLQRSGRFLKFVEGDADQSPTAHDLRDQARLLVDLYRAVPQLYPPDSALELVAVIRDLLGEREGEKAAKRLSSVS